MAASMLLSAVARYRGAVHGRLPIACGTFKGDLLIAVAGYAAAGEIQFFEPLENTKVFRLLGHFSAIEYLQFNGALHQMSTQLCSASDDCILLWDLQSCRESYDKCIECHGKVLATNVGHIQCLKFSSDSQFIAFGHWNEALIYRTKSLELDATLRGHDGNINGVEFLPSQTYQIMTISDDRTFKIWDLKRLCVLYQSAILSAWPLTCVAIHPHTKHFLIGSSDGKLRCFAAEYSNDLLQCHCMQECDIGRAIKKRSTFNLEPSVSDTKTAEISSKPKWRDPIPNSNASMGTEIDVGMESSLVSICFWVGGLCNLSGHGDSTSYHGDNEHPIKDVLQQSDVVVIATHHGIILLRMSTLELIAFKDLKDPLPQDSSLLAKEAEITVPVMDLVLFATLPESAGELYCLSTSYLEPSALLFKVTLSPPQISTPEAEGPGTDIVTMTTTISVLSKDPLCEGSPLLAEMTGQSTVAKSKVSSAGSSRKKNGPTDKPLTFKSKIRSSGYASQPVSKMFTPTTKKVKKASSIGSLGNPIAKMTEYPMTADPVSNLESSFSVSDHSSAINSLVFSGDGRHLACGCTDKSVYVLPSPFKAGRTTALVGHSGSILSAQWSLDSQYLITALADKTASLWSLHHKQPLLVISSTKHNTGSPPGSKVVQSAKRKEDNPPFPHEIRHSQFYYIDKFILVVSGKSFYLYKYHIDKSVPDDVKRYHCSTKCKLVKEFSLKSAHQITAFSAINEFYSYLVFAGGSDKNVEVFDMNTSQSVVTLQEVHQRPPHLLLQNKGSKFTTHPPEAYDLFLTAAVSDGVKLWDIRTAKCVQHYTGHPSRGIPMGVALSPCSRYISAGSENRFVHIYDIRSPAPLNKLRGQSDVTTSLVYHPLYNELVCGTLDGRIYYYHE